MNINTLKRSLMLCRAAGITPFVWSHRGYGKSSIVKQLCREQKIGFVDFRVSQIEASDLRGLPHRENGRTVYLPPAEMPSAEITWDQYQEQLKAAGDRAWEIDAKLQPKIDKGILFLDEANRGQDDVAQALFQLVLDGRIGSYTLPPGWTVFAAGNFMEGYMVNGFTDPAFINRFCHLTLSGDETTQPEWVNYMEAMFSEEDKDGNFINHAGQIIEFAAQNTTNLYGTVKGDLGFSIQPSPRSWEAVARVKRALVSIDYGTDAQRAVYQGLVGIDLANAFMSYNCPVKPEDLIRRGVDGMRDELDKLLRSKDSRQMLMGLMWGVAGRLRKSIDTDEKMAKVAMDFTRFLCDEGKDKDIAVAFCNQMIAGSNMHANLKSGVLSNPNVGKLLSRWTNGKSFMARLNADPKLQDLVSKTSWGQVH